MSRPLFTAREVEAWIREGRDPAALPPDAVITPAARDLIREHRAPRPGAAPAPPSPPSPAPHVPDAVFRWEAGGDPATPAELAAFFRSPPIETLKEKMCEVGRRMWQREFCDGNGGNITVRVGDDLVLCTPTLISKGLMRPADLCLVDLEGRQRAGERVRTSEVNTHLAIMKATPEARACVHGHPAHATAFAVASVVPPTCLCSEAEVFTGEIALVPYQTPGSPETAAAVGAVAAEHPAILLQNHGLIVWGKDLEDAYWKIENTETACKTIWIASQLGNGLHSIGPAKLKELIAIRERLGMSDKRAGWKECELCDNSEFRPGVVCAAPPPPPSGARAGDDPAPGSAEALDPAAESAVRRITDLIMERLGGGA